MKVLVTGGAGYIGAHATYELVAQGYEVVVVDSLWRGSKKNLHPQAKFYKVDLRDQIALTKIFAREANIAAIMHFAGSIMGSESLRRPLDYFNNNVYSLEILLRAAGQFKVQHIVLSSTAAVYSQAASSPVAEDAAVEPITPYGASKYMAETLLQWWAKATNSHYMIFRYFNVAGAHPNKKIGVRGANLTHLLPSVLEAALGSRRRLELFGNNYSTRDGTCVRDFIHVQDLVAAHIAGLRWIIDNKQSHVLNLGSGRGYSVAETVKRAERILNLKIKQKVTSRRRGDAAEIYACTNKAAQIINWQPQRTLDAIIKSDYEFRKNLTSKNS